MISAPCLQNMLDFFCFCFCFPGQMLDFVDIFNILIVILKKVISLFLSTKFST